MQTTHQYEPNRHEYVQVKRTGFMVSAKRAPSGLGNGHEGHHTSAYSLTNQKIRNILKKHEDTIEYYQHTYESFYKAINALNKNYNSYLHNNWPEGRWLEFIDQNATFNNRSLKSRDPLNFLRHELSCSTNRIEACLIFTESKINNLAVQHEEVATDLAELISNDIPNDGTAKTHERVAKVQANTNKSTHNERCNLYVELIEVLANEYVIQKSRQYYATFIREGNIDPIIKERKPYPLLEYKSAKRKLATMVQDNSTADAHPVDTNISKSTEAKRVVQAKLYLQAYSGTGSGGADRNTVQLAPDYLEAAVRATMDLLHYPLLEPNLMTKASALNKPWYVDTSGTAVTVIPPHSVIYEKEKNALTYTRKYAVGVFSRSNDLSVAALVLTEHFQNVFSCYPDITSDAAQAIRTEVIKQFKTDWKMDLSPHKMVKFDDYLSQYQASNDMKEPEENMPALDQDDLLVDTNDQLQLLMAEDDSYELEQQLSDISDSLDQDIVPPNTEYPATGANDDLNNEIPNETTAIPHDNAPWDYSDSDTSSNIRALTDIIVSNSKSLPLRTVRGIQRAIQAAISYLFKREDTQTTPSLSLDYHEQPRAREAQLFRSAQSVKVHHEPPTVLNNKPEARAQQDEVEIRSPQKS